jgi:REP element-mobilizing transposase RayT
VAVAIPPRKRLPHDIPLWIDPSKENYFITVCCAPRGRNQLALRAVGRLLFDTVTYRNETGIWFAHLVLLMPDHAHLILSSPESGKRMQTIVSKWKEWTSKAIGIKWHRDFFEHRLRNEQSFREKADYILANPVRAHLVSVADDWPYVFIGEA